MRLRECGFSSTFTSQNHTLLQLPSYLNFSGKDLYGPASTHRPACCCFADSLPCSFSWVSKFAAVKFVPRNYRRVTVIPGAKSAIFNGMCAAMPEREAVKPKVRLRRFSFKGSFPSGVKRVNWLSASAGRAGGLLPVPSRLWLCYPRHCAQKSTPAQCLGHPV